MNFKTTLILLALLAIVGVVIVMDRVRSTDAPVAEKRDPSEPKALVKVSDFDVTKIEISGDRVPAFAIEKQRGGEGDTWVISGAASGPADPAVVSNHIRRVTSLTGKDEPAKEAQAAFKPALTVNLGTASGKPATVAVSGPNAVGEAVAKIDQDGKTTWSIVPGETAEQLGKLAATFRDPRLVLAKQADISDVWLDHGDTSLHLIKDIASGDWQIHNGTYAPGVKADRVAIDDLLRSIAGLRSESAVTGKPEGAFKFPQLTIRYATVAPTTQPTTQPTRKEGFQGIRFGRYEDARKERLFATRFSSASLDDSEIVTVRASVLSSMTKSQLDLRDKQVLELQPDTITQIQVVNPTLATTRPETALTLTRELPTPATTQPAEAPAPAWKVNQATAEDAKVTALLNALTPLRASRFLSGEGASLVVTPWVVRIHTTKGIHEFLVGNQAVKFGDLTFVPETELLPLLEGGFAAPPKPVPFIDAADPETTQPTTSPIPAPTTQP